MKLQTDRVTELVRCLSDAAKRGALFHNFERALKTEVAARVGRYAADLASLNDAAWIVLKGEAARRFARRWSSIGCRR